MKIYLENCCYNPFDYTKWREDLFDNMSLQELAQKANEYCESFE